MKYATVAVLVSLAVLSTSVAAFDWSSTAESSHQHNWVTPKMGSRIDHQNDLAKRSMLERRAKLGLYIPKAGSTPDTSTPGLLGSILGFAYGLQYDSKKPGQCYDSLESTIEEIEGILEILAQIYNPSNWAQLAIGFQNWILLGTSVYSYCDMQKFFNTVTAIFTAEGGSTLAARLAGGFIFELPIYIAQFTDATQSDFMKFNALGKIFQLTFNYSIN